MVLVILSFLFGNKCFAQTTDLSSESIYYNADSLIAKMFSSPIRVSTKERPRLLLAMPALMKTVEHDPKRLTELRIVLYMLWASQENQKRVDSLGALIDKSDPFIEVEKRIKYQLAQCRNYYVKGGYREGFEMGIATIKLAKEQKDKLSMAEAFSLTALLNGMYDSSATTLNYYREALSIALRERFLRVATVTANNMAEIFVQNKQLDSAKFFYQLSLNLASEGEGQEYIPLIRAALASVLYKLGEKSDAFQEYYAIIPMAKNLGLPEYLHQSYYSLAELYLSERRLDSSRHYAKLCLAGAEEQGNTPLKVRILKLLAEISYYMGYHADAYQYQQQHQALKDSLITQERISAIAEARQKLEMENQEEKFRLKEKQLLVENQLLAAVVIILLLAAVAYYFFRRQKIESAGLALKSKELLLEKAELENRTREQEIQLAKIRQRATEQALELEKQKQERFAESLVLKERLLASQALNIATKSELIEDVTALLEKNERKLPTSLINKVQKLAEMQTSEDDWVSFKDLFDQVHPQFIENLLKISAELTQSDIRLAAYIIMQVNNKQVAQMLGITYGSLRNARVRLRNKLGLGAEDDLNNFLFNLRNQSKGTTEKD